MDDKLPTVMLFTRVVRTSPARGDDVDVIAVLREQAGDVERVGADPAPGSRRIFSRDQEVFQREASVGATRRSVIAGGPRARPPYRFP